MIFTARLLCVSAVFAVVRCLSVRPSRSCIVSRRLRISSKFFLGRVAPSFYFFLIRAPVSNSNGNPFSGGVKYTAVGKIFNFRLKSPFISETVRDILSPLLQRNFNRKSYVADRSVWVPMTLGDLERRNDRGQIFQADLLNKACIIKSKTTKFGMITHVGVTYL